MSSLRDELGAAPHTPYTLLCPPGWRRVAPEELVSGPSAAATLDAAKASGRAELYVQLRAMSARYRQAMRELKVVDVYVPPVLDDGVPLPATMLVAPFVLPQGVPWEAALVRLAAGAAVDRPDFARTPMWVWRRRESMSDETGSVTAKETVYLVPVPDEKVHRALRFQFTVLVPPTEDGPDKADQLVELGDLMMSTMHWRDAPADSAATRV